MVDWEDFTKKFQSLPAYFPSDDDELMHTYEGILFLKVTPASSLREIKVLEVRQDDLFLISYPKAGTTWMQQIISMILKETGKDDSNDAEHTHLFFKFPFLEMSWVKHYSQLDLLPPTHRLLDHVPSPRTIKTHLPSAMLPKQLFDKKPKVIYIARNPKDLAVSYFHMHQKDITLKTYKDWESFIEDFITGNIDYGSWFDHTLFWWNRRHEENVLFMKYEDMQHDLHDAINKVANFLGANLTVAMTTHIAEQCSFNSMKKNRNCNPDTLGFMDSDPNKPKQQPEQTVDGATSDEPQAMFMRKGKIGDWKNYFSDEQSSRLDAQYKVKMEGSGLTFDFGE
ncbi:sulfotransferase 1A3-like isoform X2 [Amphiura filiformis]|uniref:sulfotransferase 1A3-like isoform X2 n=1 Tax=Amphiura filiformis TaxID=82378 RepID=UPI003B21E1CA